MRLTVLHKLPSGCFLYLPVLFYGIIQNMMLKKVKDNYEKKGFNCIWRMFQRA